MSKRVAAWLRGCRQRFKFWQRKRRAAIWAKHYRAEQRRKRIEAGMPDGYWESVLAVKYEAGQLLGELRAAGPDRDGSVLASLRDGLASLDDAAGAMGEGIDGATDGALFDAPAAGGDGEREDGADDELPPGFDPWDAGAGRSRWKD